MKNKIILLVEDNEDDEMLTIHALKAGNITNQIHVVRDGAEALDYLFCQGAYKDRDPTANPQVVLLDLKLPKIDGLDVLKEVRENPKTKRLPVVILTSSREDQDVIRGYDLGANAYVCKPVDLPQFSAAVKQLGLFWVLLNESTQD